ncbi:MAG: 23S rRNA (guanosine(2251)-2'-O)-methyltransferase RlmB [Rikenellaceae bacterium]
MAEKDNIVFGLRPVIEAIEAGKEIDKIFIKKGSDSPIMEQLRATAKQNGIQVQDVPIEKLNRLTRNNHQGVIAQVSPIVYAEISEVIDNLTEESKVPLIMLMDSITDIRNFGAIARSAECAGVNAIIMPIKNSAPVNAEAIKSSAGALNLINVCRVGSIRNTLKYLAESGLQVVAANEKASKMPWEVDFTVPTVIVMGSEDTGISKEVLKLCNELVSIPMIGKIESLNVSVAAGVILFEAVRQRL